MNEKLSYDAGLQIESKSGPTDLGLAYAARAKSLRLLSAVIDAQVSWFTRSSRLPRHASLVPTTKVETVHPPIELLSLIDNSQSGFPNGLHDWVLLSK